MYDYKDIKSIHLEVTSKCQARCPMCPRRINGGPMMPWVTLDEITLDQFKTWFPIEFIKQLHKVNMCGNLGDPIIAKDTVKIFAYLRSFNENIHLQMHTNGSARSETFWKEIANLKVTTVFGIDGLEDTHSRYRIGTNFQQIIKNAKIFINAGGDARWDMLVFDHNKHLTEECENLAYRLGFKSFQKKNSSRFKEGKFNVLDDSGKTIDILYPTESSKDFIEKSIQSKKEHEPKISCKAKRDMEIYVAANGNVSPCCWLDTEWLPPISDERISYMDNISQYPNLYNHSLEDIFKSKYFSNISNTWKSKSCLLTCKKQCGSFDKLGAQFES